MNKKIWLNTLLLTLPIAYADVPFKFTAGTPAKAAEVNSNFEHLNKKINEIITKETNTCSDFSKFDVNYESSNSNSNLGDSITINGVNFLIGKILVEDKTNNNQYIVQYPMRDGGGTVFVEMNSTNKPQKIQCEDIVISGYKAQALTTNVEEGFNRNQSITYDKGQYHYNETITPTWQSITLQIGDTTFLIESKLHLKVDFPQVSFSYNGTDFTDKITENTPPTLDSLYQPLDDFIDHIKIEQVQ